MGLTKWPHLSVEERGRGGSGWWAEGACGSEWVGRVAFGPREERGGEGKEGGGSALACGPRHTQKVEGAQGEERKREGEWANTSGL